MTAWSSQLDMLRVVGLCRAITGVAKKHRESSGACKWVTFGESAPLKTVVYSIDPALVDPGVPSP